MAGKIEEWLGNLVLGEYAETQMEGHIGLDKTRRRQLTGGGGGKSPASGDTL
jgi:hypothetical protein